MKVGDQFKVKTRGGLQTLLKGPHGHAGVDLPPGGRVIVTDISGDDCARLLLSSGETCVYFYCHDAAEFDHYFVNYSPLEQLALCAGEDTDGY